MTKTILLVACTALAFFVLTSFAIAQEPSTVTIRGTEILTGVVLISGQQLNPMPGRRASFELQCNKGMTQCAPLQPGTYTLVRLPKNHGMYDCVNADVYAKDADPETSEKLGEYCLTEK